MQFFIQIAWKATGFAGQKKLIFFEPNAGVCRLILRTGWISLFV
jgi:hypothetical protein